MKLSKRIIGYFIGLAIFGIGFFVLPNQIMGRNCCFLVTVILAGYDVTREGIQDTIERSKEAHHFVPNIHILMCLAALGSIIIGSFEEAALLILIFAAADYLEDYADQKSKKEINSLLKMKPLEARIIKNDGSIEIVDVKKLKIGNLLQVLDGAQVPTDGVITEGIAFINESSVNGESIPREKQVGDDVFGGTINGNSTFNMRVTKNSSETIFAKIIEMVETAQATPTKTATTIQKLEPIYVKTVLFLLPLVLLAGPLVFKWNWQVSFYRMIGFLVAASPCALAASAVPATLSAISNLARNGVLFKGGSHLANLSQLKAIAFDKTGTLTQGEPTVTNTYFSSDYNHQDLIDILVAMEKQSNHPLAKAVIEAFPNATQIKNVACQNQIGQGIQCLYQGHHYAIRKPDSFVDVSQTFEQRRRNWSKEGKIVIYLGVEETVVGVIALMDLPKKTAYQAIDYFNRCHIDTVMISGDSEDAGQAVADKLGIKEVVTNVMPEEKVKVINHLQKKYQDVAMVGDGINDAPALANAEIGIAMGSGTDVAIDVADVILVKNDLSRLTFAHYLSKRMNRIVMENIFFSLTVVLLLLVLNILEITNIAWGVLLHEGSTLLVTFNGLRLLMIHRTR